MTTNADLDACPSCGARGSDVIEGRAVCRFCGTEFVPRLLPGALCCDPAPRRCRRLADCLCGACGRALCPRHGAPRTVYWNEPLDWRHLLPSWTDAEATMWARIVSPLPALPVASFDPFEWTDFSAAVERELGELEAGVVQRLRAEVARFGGSVREEGVLLEAIRKIVLPLAPEFRKALFERRLDAIEAELRQSLRYVEAVLKKPVPTDE